MTLDHCCPVKYSTNKCKILKILHFSHFQAVSDLNFQKNALYVEYNLFHRRNIEIRKGESIFLHFKCSSSWIFIANLLKNELIHSSQPKKLLIFRLIFTLFVEVTNCNLTTTNFSEGALIWFFIAISVR